jgi:hypothetical protein
MSPLVGHTGERGSQLFDPPRVLFAEPRLEFDALGLTWFQCKKKPPIVHCSPRILFANPHLAAMNHKIISAIKRTRRTLLASSLLMEEGSKGLIFRMLSIPQAHEENRTFLRFFTNGGNESELPPRMLL